MTLWIVVPTYNEAENLPRLLERLFALPLQMHVLIVDDNSPDGTGRVAENLRQVYPGRLEVLHRREKLGLGPAYRAGFRYVLERGATVIGQMDADLSHPPERLPALWERLREADVALGSRYVPGGGLDPNWSWWRKFLSWGGNLYARTLLGLPIRDVTGGYRLWKRTVLEHIPLDRVQSTGYVFQVEMIYLAHQLGFRIVEVPIFFRDRQWGTSKMSFAVQREAALAVLALRWRWRHLKKAPTSEPGLR